MKRELDAADQALSKLYEGVEKGILELDATLQTRAQGHKAKREAILTEMAGIATTTGRAASGPERGQGASVLPSAQERVAWIEQGIRQALLGYLRALVSDIRVAGNLVTITGSDVALAAAVAGIVALDQRVPRLGMGWLPDLGSNQGPAD